MTKKETIEVEPIRAIWLSVPRSFVVGALLVILCGIVLLIIGLPLAEQGWRRLQLGYLVALSFVLSLSLGSLFLVILQHLTRAGWSVAIRRPAEILALNVVSVALLSIPLAWWVAQGELYPWAAIQREDALMGDVGKETSGNSRRLPGVTERSAEPTDMAPRSIVNLAVEARTVAAVMSRGAGESLHARLDSIEHGSVSAENLYVHQTLDELTKSKSFWLNRIGFLVRMAVCLAIWAGVAGFYFQQSKRQDKLAGGSNQTLLMERFSGPAMLLFAITLTLGAFDWLMSLDPHWYSTMFGVYYFSGCAVGGVAVNLLLLLLLQKANVMPQQVSVEHLRDLGRFQFAFVFFWGYIAFSQYMLLWYANMPETTRWLAVRGASQAEGYTNSWGWLLLLLLFGHFLVPFLGIMSRHVKSSPRAMAGWTIWLLIMHYFDLYWLVMPELGGQLTFGPIELGSLLLVCGTWILSASFLATRISLLPIGDPRLKESLRLTEVY